VSAARSPVSGWKLLTLGLLGLLLMAPSRTATQSVARYLGFSNGTLLLGAKPALGDVLYYDGSSITKTTPGSTNGLATLGSDGRVPNAQLPSSAYSLTGTWNANTDLTSPGGITLAGTTPAVGTAYAVTTAGSTTLGSVSSWTAGDLAVYTAAGWARIPAAGVTSYNSRFGAVSPAAGDYDGLALNLAAASSFRVPQGSSCSQTAEGAFCWDTDDELTIGTSSGRKTMVDSEDVIAVAQGGTGASTAAGARDGILWSGGGAIAPSSPYTAVAGVHTITCTSACEVDLQAASAYANGQILRVVNDSGSSFAVTFDPAGSDTLDGGSAGASASYTVQAHGSVGAIRTSSTTWGSVQSSALSATGFEAYLTGGAWTASLISIDPQTGAKTRIGSPVAMTAEGTDYDSGDGDEALSGDTLTLTGPLVGDSGAVQSNSRRWTVALSSLGWTMTASTTRWAYFQMLCDSITDNGEARSQTLNLGSFLGAGGTTTALVGYAIQRPATGTQYIASYFNGSATGSTAGNGSTDAVGLWASHAFGNGNSERIQASTLNTSGEDTAATSASGAAIAAGVPTHLVVYLRSGAAGSGGVFDNCRMSWHFGPIYGGGGL